MLLSLIVVAIAVIQFSVEIPPNINKVLEITDFIIWVLFVIDYVLRLMIAQNKKHFLIHHKIDLITILPFNSLFRIARLFKITRLMKLLKLTKGIVFLNKFSDQLKLFLKTNNFHYMLITTVITIFIGAGLISIAENMKFDDALWWSYVTATTVGYGDISPSTSIGRIIASILMIVGIGFLGMLTSTISMFFLTRKSKLSYKDEMIENIKNKLDDIDSLSDEDIDDIGKILKALKQKDN